MKPPLKYASRWLSLWSVWPATKKKIVLTRVKSQIIEELNVKNIEAASAEELAKPEYKVVSDGGYSVAVPIEIPAELKAEGMAREITHRMQGMRRSAGFEIADYIMTYFQGDDYIRQVMRDYADYIKQETLSREINDAVPAEGAYTETYKLEGHQVLLGVKKVVNAHIERVR